MRLVVLESPFAGEIERNIIYARRAVRHALEQGDAPIASHLLFTQPSILRDEVPEERAWGIGAGLAWLPHAAAQVVYTDYGISPGMMKAIDAAQLAGVVTEYRQIGINPYPAPAPVAEGQ